MIPHRWGFTFLQSDSKLTEKQRESLLYQATEMYLNTVFEQEIFLQDSLEGRISTKGEQGVLGCFVGVKFSAEVYTQKGKAHLSFLVSEQTQRSIKGYEN